MKNLLHRLFGNAGKYWPVLAAGLAVYCAVVTYADPLILLVCLCVGLLFIGLPCAVVTFITLVFSADHRLRRRPTLLGLSRALIIVGCILLMLPINSIVQQRAVTTAESYPARIRSLLEQYREEHGSYPADLDELSSRPHVPRLLRYHSNGQVYVFSIFPPGDITGTMTYRSDTEHWSRSY